MTASQVVAELTSLAIMTREARACDIDFRFTSSVGAVHVSVSKCGTFEPSLMLHSYISGPCLAGTNALCVTAEGLLERVKAHVSQAYSLSVVNVSEAA